MPGASVVQLLGSRPAALGFAAETCTANIARQLGALCVNLHAPLILSEAALAAKLRAEPVISALRGGFATHLATCALTARALLEA